MQVQSGKLGRHGGEKNNTSPIHVIARFEMILRIDVGCILLLCIGSSLKMAVFLVMSFATSSARSPP